MGVLDWVIVAVVALWGVGAAVWMIRRKKQGKTCCGCDGGCCDQCRKK